MVQRSLQTGATTTWPIDIYTQHSPDHRAPQWRWGWVCRAHNEPVISFGYESPAGAFGDLAAHVESCRGQ